MLIVDLDLIQLMNTIKVCQLNRLLSELIIRINKLIGLVGDEMDANRDFLVFMEFASFFFFLFQVILSVWLMILCWLLLVKILFSNKYGFFFFEILLKESIFM